MSVEAFGNLPLEWVRVFQVAGVRGSFTAAARETGLTQAAVSQRIRNLEHHVGAHLFTRQARGVTLTAEGEAWLPHVTAALQALGRSTEELFGAPLKTLTIAASNTVIRMWIGPRLKNIQTTDGAQLTLTTMTIEPDFSRMGADIAIRFGKGDWPDMRVQRLYQERLCPVVSPDLVAGNIDWLDLPVIGVVGPRPGWQAWALAAGRASMPRPALRFDSYAAAHDAALAGHGVLLGSMILCQADIAAGRLVRLSDVTLEPDAGYWLTASDGRVPPAQWRQICAGADHRRLIGVCRSRQFRSANRLAKQAVMGYNACRHHIAGETARTPYPTCRRGMAYTEADLSGTYRILVRDLIVPAEIGVYDYERGRPQRVRISLTVEATRDLDDPDITGVVSYEDLINGIKAAIARGHIELVETLGDMILDLCFQYDRVEGAMVRIEKIDIFGDADAVGVEMTRVRT